MKSFSPLRDRDRAGDADAFDELEPLGPAPGKRTLASQIQTPALDRLHQVRTADLVAEFQRRLPLPAGTRVLSDRAAGAVARSHGREGVSVGEHVYLDPARFDPTTPAGRHLLGHELTHVVQQSLTSPRGERRAAEREANAVADWFAFGTPFVQPRVAMASSEVLGYDADETAEPATGEQVEAEPPPDPQHIGVELARFHTAQTRSATIRADDVLSHRVFDPDADMSTFFTVEGAQGFYDSEEAAWAALRARDRAGAVIAEGDHFVAYTIDVSAQTRSRTTQFRYRDVRWVRDRPWTRVEMTGPATGILTSDGVMLRPEMYTPEAEVETRIDGMHLMPGTENPIGGYREIGDEIGMLGRDDFLTAFGEAMQDLILASLAESRHEATVLRDRYTGGLELTTEEIAYAVTTARWIVAIDDEIRRVEDEICPAGIWTNRAGAFYVRQDLLGPLERDRAAAVAEYPILGHFSRQGIRDFVELGSVEEQANQLGAEAAGVIEDIDRTRENILRGRVSLWSIMSAIESTCAMLEISDEERQAWIEAEVQRQQARDTRWQLAVAAISIALGLVATFATGPLGAAAAIGSLVVSVGDAVNETIQFSAQQAAGNTDIDQTEALVQDAGEIGWLVLAWAFVLPDVSDAASAVARVSRGLQMGLDMPEAVARAIDELDVDDGLATQLREAAEVGDASSGFAANADLADVEARLGTGIDIDDSLGTEIRVQYAVADNGDVLVTNVVCGGAARVDEILLHAEVIRLLERYNGVVGELRRLLDRVRAALGPLDGPCPFQPGTRAFESWHELEKLPGLISARTEALNDTLSTADEAAILRDIDFLRSEYARHDEIVEELCDEAGDGFVRRAGEDTRNAITDHGMPDPGESAITRDFAEHYYYRRNPNGPPPYRLARFQSAPDQAPPARVVQEDGDWVIASGRLSPREEARLMESSLGELELAYTSFQTAHGSARVVPLQGIAATEHSLGGIIQRAGSADALIDLLARALVDDPRGARVAAEHAVADLDAHRVVVVQGTRQLRRFGYRIHYARNSGQRIEGDLHHLIPLYLGGNHGVGNFLDLDPVIHAELHRLIDGIATEELGTTLAPSAIQSCSELTFETGAAALYPDGRIVLARLGTEGRYEQVSTTFE